MREPDRSDYAEKYLFEAYAALCGGREGEGRGDKFIRECITAGDQVFFFGIIAAEVPIILTNCCYCCVLMQLINVPMCTKVLNQRLNWLKIGTDAKRVIGASNLRYCTHFFFFQMVESAAVIYLTCHKHLMNIWNR